MPSSGLQTQKINRNKNQTSKQNPKNPPPLVCLFVCLSWLFLEMVSVALNILEQSCCVAHIGLELTQTQFPLSPEYWD